MENMKKKKNTWKILYKIGVTLAYLLCILILCMQALTPGSESSTSATAWATQSTAS
ncbi:MAG: hypothetical protein J6A24_00280 [Clostridia bacterium]|nr:hypothetical protein [Clostridia bacterium]